MKHIKLFETKFTSPGLKDKNIGKFLVGTFFEEIDIFEVIEEEILEFYNIEITFNNLTSSIFEKLVNIKNVLHSDYNVKYDEIEINSRDNEGPYLEIIVRGYENIEKLNETIKNIFDKSVLLEQKIVK